MDFMMTLDKRVTWTITDNAELEETGGDSVGLVRRDALDVEILLTLLTRHQDLIHREADKARRKLYGRDF